jgi:sugar lactone lactonase YvrE
MAALLFGLLLTGCAAQPVQPKPTPIAQNTAVPAVPTISPTATPTDEIITLQEKDQKNSTNNGYLPNLWTKIEKDKISLYPIDQLSDFAYDKAGGLWLVGGFGVIHDEPGGKQSWYSIKNGLPTNSFKIIAISPSDEIWVGGADNALFRFDGKQWIDEGIKLPEPYDTSTGWLCYSKDIAGIDFDQEGKAWVMNAGIEIYTQLYGQWLNFPFPKSILPWAGGGACPQGIRVISENDITIKKGGCCDSGPSGYHFDGQAWSGRADYKVVDQLKNTRHQFDPRSFKIGHLETSGYTNWPFDKSNAGILSVIPEQTEIGGQLKLNNGRRLVGFVGSIWVFDQNLSQNWIVPSATQLFTLLSEAPDGIIYAATDTGVYKLDGKNFSVDNFVRQDSKPIVVSDDGNWGDCAFHKYYTILGNCPNMWRGSPTIHYTAKLLQAQPDGSVIYVNNKVIAKYENGKWKSFLFDTFDIEYATVDKDGFIWIWTGENGRLRLAPDIFDSYLPLNMH